SRTYLPPRTRRRTLQDADNLSLGTDGAQTPSPSNSPTAFSAVRTASRVMGPGTAARPLRKRVVVVQPLRASNVGLAPGATRCSHVRNSWVGGLADASSNGGKATTVIIPSAAGPA